MKLALVVGVGLVWLLVAGALGAVCALVLSPAAAFVYGVVRYPPA